MESYDHKVILPGRTNKDKKVWQVKMLAAQPSLGSAWWKKN